jgi:hypothetical protein
MRVKQNSKHYTYFDNKKMAESVILLAACGQKPELWPNVN